MPLRKLLRKLCGDRNESKADSPPPPSPRLSTVKNIQSTEPFKPQDLWQTAYDQLDEEKRRILSTLKDTADPNDKENRARIEDLIGQIIDLTKEQYKEYQQNANRKIRKYSKNIINAALSTKDIIGAAATFDPTQHAASAWAIVSLGLTMTKNYRDRQDALFESSDYLADVLTQCAFIEQKFYCESRSGNQQDFGNILIRLYRAILSYTAVVQQNQSASKGKKLLDCVSAITEHPLTELKALIEKEREDLRRHIELDEYLRRGEEAENILYKIDDLAESMKLLVERFSLVNLRVAEGALYDSYINQHEDFCLPDTRTDLQRQILEWAKSDEKFIFWLNGMAGTGKSTIARTVARLLKNQRMLGATFFFKRGEADRGNAKLLVSTIAVQLVSQHPQLLPAVLDAIKNDTYIASKSLGEQFDKLIYQPLVQQHADQSRMIVIVIDALDECDRGDDMRLILRLLFQLQEIKTVHLRVLLTSRPELPIRLGFKKEVNHQDLLLHELPAEMIRHDIRVFLEYKLSEIRDERELSLDWPGQENIEKLVIMAVPLFIFAATLCRFVGDTDWLPQERLLAVLQDKAATSASEMERTYLPVLNQLVASKSKRDCTTLLQEFQDIIGVIILLAAPLSVVALAQLTGKSKDSVSNRLNKFHAVLNIPKNPEKPVRILHLSFRDFLVSTKSDFYINEHETHGKIALHCLQLMETRLKHNICGLASYGIQRKDIDPQVINQHLTAELQYSCRYWVYHLKQSQGRISESEILSFLKKRFLHWLEALALIGSISDSVEIIDTLMLATWTDIGADISDFLYDAKRFALQNTYIAGIAPLQLYSSGLVFAPAQSIVKQTFFSEIGRQIQRLPVLEDSWSPNLQTLEGHSDSVISVAFSPDGRTLASGSDDATIKLWDTMTGTERQTLEGHSDSVNSVAFSPDGRTLASGSGDDTIKLWDTMTGTERQTLKGHSDSVNSVAFSPDGRTLASGSDDDTIKLWDTMTGTERQTLEGQSGFVISVAFSPDGRTLASGSRDTIKLWDTMTGTERQTLKGHSDSVISVAFSPDGRTLASGSRDDTIKLWDTMTGTERQTLKGHSSTAPAVLNELNSNLHISLSNAWIALGDENILWLPVEYRPFTCHAVKDAVIALGYTKGRVCIVGFHNL
ncbi:hypothetical protein RU639_013594 [Aspergillus parasiticus]